jgi:DNA-binding IclR family transcriptional regulator
MVKEDEGTAESGAVAAVMEVLASTPHAMFMTELFTRVPLNETTVEQVCKTLAGTRLLVVDHRSPDPHITGDLRVVSLIFDGAPDANAIANRRMAALRAASDVWDSWVRDLLSSHRCG